METKNTYLAEMAVMTRRISELQAAIRENVDLARSAGASWAEVGRALGISQQGAQQRFTPKSPGRIGPSTLPRESRHDVDH